MSRASVVFSTAESETTTCLSAWPKLCAKLLKSITQSGDDDDGSDDGGGDDVATSALERLVQLRDVAPMSTRSVVSNHNLDENELLEQCKDGRLRFTALSLSLTSICQSVNQLLNHLYDCSRQCELVVRDLLSSSDGVGVVVETLDNVALIREIVTHAETNYQLRNDMVTRFANVTDGDERQVLRLAWQALPAPLPEHRRFVVQQRLAELISSNR
jgi:hypothetical protein